MRAIGSANIETRTETVIGSKTVLVREMRRGDQIKQDYNFS